MGEGVRVAAGADTSGAPSPSDGIGARPVSIDAPVAGFSTAPACADGAAAGAAGVATRASEDPLRLPNTTVSEIFLEFDQFKLDQTPS